MKIVKRVLMTLIGLAVVFVVVGFLLPSTVTMKRSIVIDAPAAAIFPMLNEPRSFNEWSPWYEKDPQANYRYEGPQSGVGATVHWQSENPKVGNGSQEIIESRENNLVRSRLDFGAQGTAEAWFDLQSDGEETLVTWSFFTDLGGNIIGRYFGLVMESMLAPDFEAGLEKLRTVLEADG